VILHTTEEQIEFYGFILKTESHAWFQKLNKKRLLLRCLFQKTWQFDVYSIFVLKCYFLIMTKKRLFMTSMKNLAVFVL